MRFARRDDLGDLAHHRLIDVQASGGVDDHGVPSLGRRPGRERCDIVRDASRIDSTHRDTELLSQCLELVDRGGTMDVGRDKQRMAALFAEHVRELRCCRRLPRALKSCEDDDRRRRLGARKRRGRSPEHVDDRVVDDLDDLLGAGDRFEHPLAERALTDRGDELTDDFEVDVGLEERDAHVPQGLLEIGLGDAWATPEALERVREPVRELLEHQLTAVSTRSTSVSTGRAATSGKP